MLHVGPSACCSLHWGWLISKFWHSTIRLIATVNYAVTPLSTKCTRETYSAWPEFPDIFACTLFCVPCDALAALAGNWAVTVTIIVMEDCHRKLNKVVNNCASAADLPGYQLYVTVNLRPVKEQDFPEKVNIVLSRLSGQWSLVPRLVMRVIYVPCKTYRVLVTSPVRGVVVRGWCLSTSPPLYLSTAVPTARWWGATTTKPANELRLFYCFI